MSFCIGIALHTHPALSKSKFKNLNVYYFAKTHKDGGISFKLRNQFVSAGAICWTAA